MLIRIAIVLLAVDILVNALTGGAAYQTVSCRIGLNIRRQGLASRIPWPEFMLHHFETAVYNAVV